MSLPEIVNDIHAAIETAEAFLALDPPDIYEAVAAIKAANYRLVDAMASEEMRGRTFARDPNVRADSYAHTRGAIRSVSGLARSASRESKPSAETIGNALATLEPLIAFPGPLFETLVPMWRERQ